MELGYKLASEEQGPNELVRYAGLAEEHGFGFALISDHFHPWIDRQGQSPFVWSVIGAIAQTTKRLRLGTAVTCPTVRVHPAIVAQASATAAAMMPGRFFLGVGTGENLNEHVVGQGWPETAVRQARLIEAIRIIRLLWEGGMQSFHGAYYTVENARLYTLPPKAPPLMVAVGGSKSLEIAASLGDGMIGTETDKKLVKGFKKAAGTRRPCYGELTVCWAKDEDKARQTARERWPIQAMSSALAWELPLPAHFEAAAELVTDETIGESMACGPDPKDHLEALQEYADAGFDHVCVHQVGPDQEGFMQFYRKEIFLKLRAGRKKAA
jgi:coenzyme F420-dependent glucose-6-phosphate dehydrogenase